MQKVVPANQRYWPRKEPALLADRRTWTRPKPVPVLSANQRYWPQRNQRYWPTSVCLYTILKAFF